MNRWANLLACAVVVTAIGCAGAGNDPGGGGGGGGGGGDSIASVNTALFNQPGRVEATYNSGQGRAVDSPTAVLRRLYIEDEIGLVETLLQSEVKIQLDGYTSQSMEVNPPMTGFSVPIASRKFGIFPLEVQAIEVEQFDGSFVRYQNTNGSPLLSELFPTRITAMPGRITSLQIFLDDATLNHDGSGVQFDRPRFEGINFDPTEGMIMGFLSDYVMFDITNVANKPEMSTGGFANRVYFSGDSIALSLDPAQGGSPFEVLTPLLDPIEGLVTPPNAQFSAPGQYTLRQIDPRDLSNIARITALQGIWRPYWDPNPTQSLLLNVGAFEVITIPNSTDGAKQEIVMIERNGAGQIVNMHFGEVDFSAGTFAVWPIDQVDTGDGSNEVNGTVTDIVYRAGVPSPTYRDIREGRFAITSGSVPAGYSASGRFVVLRL